MKTTLNWEDICLRLGCAIAAGAILGINRSERGMAAGLRTTLLVCVAAAVAMLQVNLLLPTAGRPHDSFIMNDLMRFPLGILTGMGFIGAGAILRRGKLIVGITTAATLWLVTVIGLCFGGGQIGLGFLASAVAASVLWSLKRLERRIPQERHAILALTIGASGPSTDEIRDKLVRAGYEVATWDICHLHRDGIRWRKLKCGVRWRAKSSDVYEPEVVHQLASLPDVESARWSA